MQAGEKVICTIEIVHESIYLKGYPACKEVELDEFQGDNGFNTPHKHSHCRSVYKYLVYKILFPSSIDSFQRATQTERCS